MKRTGFLLLGQVLVIAVVCIEGLGAISEFVSGVLIIGICCFSLLGLIKHKLLFTPLLFPYVYLLLFGFYEMKLRMGMGVMTTERKLIIVTCMLIWVIMCLSAKSIFTRVDCFAEYKVDLSRLKKWIVLLMSISLPLMLFEWYKAGGIPALQANAETSRMSVSQSGMIHTLAIMIKIVAVLIEVFWIARHRVDVPRCRWFLPLYVFIILIMLGTANRGELIFAPVIGLIILWILRPPKKKSVLLIVIIGVIVLAIFPMVRGYGMYGLSYFTQYSRVSTYKGLGWLMPLYGTLAYNFEVLNRLFETFSKNMPWGYGQYTLFCHIPFLDIGEELWVVQNRIWQTGFYGALTSTYMGAWFADFGYFGCYFGTILICSVNLLLYNRMVKRKDLTSLVCYAYLFYITLVGSYGDAFNFVFFCYESLLALVMNQCESKSENRRETH